jgi:hypothetical protein
MPYEHLFIELLQGEQMPLEPRLTEQHTFLSSDLDSVGNPSRTKIV